MRFALLGALLLGGCAAVPQNAARIEAYAANAQLCGHIGTPICEARVNRVDGKAVFALTTVHVEPGRRRLGVHCRMNLGGMIGDAQTFQREIQATLDAGKRYRVEARMDPEPCTVTLTEER